MTPENIARFFEGIAEQHPEWTAQEVADVIREQAALGAFGPSTEAEKLAADKAGWDRAMEKAEEADVPCPASETNEFKIGFNEAMNRKRSAIRSLKYTPPNSSGGIKKPTQTP